MIQISRTHTRMSYTAKDFDELRAKYRTDHYILLPRLIDPSLLETFSNRLETAPFKLRSYGDFGKDEWPDDIKTSASLNFLCNGRVLLDTIEEITECGRLGCFVGKVYRMVPGHDHYDSWHDDMIEDRRVALSINLSPVPYVGGDLEIRDHDSKRILTRIQNTGFGDGIIFRIAGWLEHRRTEVKGDVPKTAFAGWFKSKPDFLGMITETSGQ